MAIVTSVRLSAMGPGLRLDSEYYTAPGAELRRALDASGVPFHLAFRSVIHPPEFVRDYLDEPGRPFLRAQNVKPGRIENREPVYVPESIYRELPSAIARTDDVLLVRTGANLADLARVTPKWDGAMVSSHTLRLVPQANAPVCALEFFFISKPGRDLLLGLRSGGTHGQINANNLTGLKLPQLTAYETKARQIARQIESASLRADNSLATAETLMLSALGLDHIELSSSRSYSRPFKDLVAGHRFGAEYYMPCKQRALDALAAMPHTTLHHHALNIRDLWDPDGASKGAMVRNFDLGDALEPFLDDTKEPMLAAEIGSTKKEFKAGDVVVSRLRSYLREIAVVRTGNGVLCVGSSEFIVLRPTGNGLSAETVLVYLRCPLVQTILKWSQDGSNHPRFNEDDLMALPVPDKLHEVSPKIERHVQAAIAARQEAARLLETAKTIVQNAILEETGS